MSQARWQGVADPPPAPPRLWQWPLVIGKLVVFGLVTLLLLPVFLLVRLAEKRPGNAGIGNGIIRLWARTGLALCGLVLQVRGQPMAGKGAVVANHSSWIDILALHSVLAVHFVAKAEVRSWPVIGFLARISGTEFITRQRSEARAQQGAVGARLQRSDSLCFFPEGTSSDGMRVLPFKSTLFAALHLQGQDREFRVQPVSLVYAPGDGLAPNFLGWWGDMDLAAHVLAVLAHSRRGRIVVILHAPVAPADHADRKSLAMACETAVRQGFEALKFSPEGAHSP